MTEALDLLRDRGRRIETSEMLTRPPFVFSSERALNLFDILYAARSNAAMPARTAFRYAQFALAPAQYGATWAARRDGGDPNVDPVEATA